MWIIITARHPMKIPDSCQFFLFLLLLLLLPRFCKATHITRHAEQTLTWCSDRAVSQPAKATGSSRVAQKHLRQAGWLAVFRCGKWINYANIFIYIQNKYLHTLNNLIFRAVFCLLMLSRHVDHILHFFVLLFCFAPPYIHFPVDLH